VLDGWFHCGGGGDDDDANYIPSGTYTECCFSISSMQVKQNHG